MTTMLAAVAVSLTAFVPPPLPSPTTPITHLTRSHAASGMSQVQMIIWPEAGVIDTLLPPPESALLLTKDPMTVGLVDILLLLAAGAFARWHLPWCVIARKPPKPLRSPQL